MEGAALLGTLGSLGDVQLGHSSNEMSLVLGGWKSSAPRVFFCRKVFISQTLIQCLLCAKHFTYIDSLNLHNRPRDYHVPRFTREEMKAQRSKLMQPRSHG